MKLFLVGVVLILSSIRAGAATSAVPLEQSSLTEIRGHGTSQPLQVTLSMEVPNVELALESNGNNKSTTTFKPNALAYVGVGLDYEKFGLTVSTKIPGTDEDTSKKGSTDNFDLDLHHSWASERIEGYYVDYHGFYIDNTADGSGVYQTRPDLSLQHLGLIYTHAFNSSFNIDDVETHHIGKIKQGGTWLGCLSADQATLSANSPIIASDPNNIYGSAGSLTNARFITAALSGGYEYVWAWSKDMVAFNISVGAGPQWQWLTLSTGDATRLNYDLTGIGYLTYAHQIDTWRLGISGKYLGNDGNLGSASLMASVGSGILFIQNQF